VYRSAAAGAIEGAAGVAWGLGGARSGPHGRAMHAFRTVVLAAAFLLAACAPKGPSGGPAMWRLADADSEIWILGTVHVLPPDLKWRTARIDTAFREADAIWFEAATKGHDVAREMSALVQQVGVNPPGVTLSSLLAPTERARLANVARSVGLESSGLESARPWLAALQLSVAMLVKQGADPDSGVESVLEAEAARLGKKVSYLETATQQMHFLADLSPEAETRFLTTTLRQIEEDAKQADFMDELWANGRVEELGLLLEGMIEEAGPEVADAIIHRRNAAWAERIDVMMQGNGRVFVAVGAAHLTGPRGVPALLRAKGHQVEGP